MPTTEELEALTKKQAEEKKKSLPADGSYFLLEAGEGAQRLYQRQGNTIVGLNFEYPDDWKGRTIGSFQGEQTNKAISALGLKDLPSDRENIALREAIDQAGLKRVDKTDLNEFVSSSKEYKPSGSTSGTLAAASTTEEKTTYADLENRDGTIYNTKTGKGYPTPSALASDMGISPNDIKWDRISSENIGYEDLENQNGTIVNTKTGKRYSTPDQLAADLDITPQQIDWTQVSAQPNQPAPDPTPFDPTDDTGDTGGDPSIDMTGWSQDMIDVFSNITDLLETQIAQGNMIQPDIDIDEATTAGFLSQAQKELDPYYTQIISLAKEDLSREFGEVKRQYGEGIEDIGEAAAERGLAFSGIRKKQETELAGSATRLAGGLGRSTERQIGSASLAGFTAPTIGTTPLYTLSGDITGELERERTVAESTRQSELEGLYRSQRALDFQT